MTSRMLLPLAGLAGFALIALALDPGRASSPDAWEAMQKKVAAECRSLALAGDFKTAVVQVDPHGTESYGLALVTGTIKNSTQEARALCAMDKKTGKAELGGDSGNWVTVKP
jgi:hypothetical protein